MDRSSIEMTVSAGGTVFREGEPGDCAYVIERGAVEIAIDRLGARIVLAHRGPGEVFGEMAIIDDKPRTASATALAPTTLLLITRDQLANRLRQTDPVLRMCLSVVLERFRGTLEALQAAQAPDLRQTAAGDAGDLERAAALREIRLEQELARSLQRGDFELHYQPIVALGDGRAVGFEALVRWRHPERGLVSPLEFIPTAEASGLIVPLGRWVLREACAALARLDRQAEVRRGAMLPDFMSVNVSGHDLRDPGFVDHVASVLRDTGIAPGRIKLEITETVLMQQPEAAAVTLARCRALGLSIALDDFGSGYSSLGYLHRFPIDTLKIDRSFVQPLTATAAAAPIVRSIVGLARDLALTSVAEGIELPGQASALSGLGCGLGQGFLYAKPLDEAAAAQFLLRPAAAPSSGPAPVAAPHPPQRKRILCHA